MSGLGKQVAGGAAWMIGFRAAQRGLGLLSTVILARLLVPDDFGLVGMAMAIYALVELFAEFSFDIALIQNQEANRTHYDTAWTLNIIFRVASAGILALGAPWFADAFGDPRLEAVVYVIGLVAMIQGFQNVGVVAFRKDFQFNMEFYFRVARKIIAFVVTVTLAFAFRNYWALVLGILASHAGATILSYLMHPYRPKPSLAATRELFGFSGWVFVNSLFHYLRERGPDLVIGRLAGSSSLGVYKISYELATLPTTELYGPIMRAVFPGLSRISDDLPRLREAYLAVQGVVTTVTVPAGIAIVVLAEPLVHLLLGAKWVAAIPVIQVIGIFGVIQVLHGNRFSLFMALGKPYWVAVMNALQSVLLLPLMAGLLMQGYTVSVAAWALVATTVVTLPIGLILVTRSTELTALEFMSVQVRPLIATTVMAAAMWMVSDALISVRGTATALAEIIGAGVIGGGAYIGALLGAWWLAGKPHGSEIRVMELAGLSRFFSSTVNGVRS